MPSYQYRDFHYKDKIDSLTDVWPLHYSDVIMGTIASQITSLTIVYSADYWDADQRKHQSSASLAFVWGIHRGPVDSPHKWPVTRNFFPFDDVIMILEMLLPEETVFIRKRPTWRHIWSPNVVTIDAVITVCHIFDARSAPKPILTYRELDPNEEAFV